MDIRNDALNVADRIGKVSTYVLSIVVVLALSYVSGYRIAEALYEPTNVQHREEFADGEPSDIIMERSDLLDDVRSSESRSSKKPVEGDDEGSMGPVQQEADHIQSGESDVEAYSADEFRYLGEIYDDRFRYCWYSQQVLPGDGLYIPGRHVDDYGYVRDGDGNLCVASNRYSIGTQIEVPFGDGYAVVYDTYEDEEDDLIDVYTDW